MDDKNKVDSSSFLLFESSGDNSEVLDSSKTGSFPKFCPGNDSDAMSCCYDEAENVVVHSIDQDSRVEGKGIGSHLYCVECGREGENEDEDEDEGVVDQDLKNGGDHKMRQPNKVDQIPKEKSGVCVESCEELMTRREQDKLFWKSCLES